MGETTKIAWCDHTFNPWIGCTRVSPGCLNCYAERQNKLYKWNGGAWGPGTERRMTSAANWGKLLQWNRAAVKGGVRRRVFCASLADVFDSEAPTGARKKLFPILEACQNLEFLLLTKRPENWLAMLPGSWLLNWPANVRMGFTAENQEWFEKRLEHAVILRSRFIVPKVFVSYEPAIGELSIASPRARLNIDWLICGGESGPHAVWRSKIALAVSVTRSIAVRAARRRGLNSGLSAPAKRIASRPFIGTLAGVRPSG